MSGEQIAIGVLTAGLCAIGIWHRRWLLLETRKGRRLVKWCGSSLALRILTVLLSLGVVWGVLFACDVIRPLRW